MHQASDILDTDLRDLDAVLTRLEAKVDALPSRAYIAGALRQAIVRTVSVAAVAGLVVVGSFAFFISR